MYSKYYPTEYKIIVEKGELKTRKISIDLYDFTSEYAATVAEEEPEQSFWAKLFGKQKPIEAPVTDIRAVDVTTTLVTEESLCESPPAARSGNPVSVPPAEDMMCEFATDEVLDRASAEVGTDFSAEYDVRKESFGDAGKLTSGEINDFRKWNNWIDLSSSEFEHFSIKRRFFPKHRYTVQVVNRAGGPVIDAAVVLKNASGKTMWEARTDNTGKAELWYNLFGTEKNRKSKFSLNIRYQGKSSTVKELKSFENGIHIVKTDWECSTVENVDIVFAVDATGSMGDEIRYLQSELLDIIERVKDKHSNINLRLGSIFYRDRSDAYLIKHSSLSGNIEKTSAFIREQNAGGGGDFPEAVDAAMFYAVSNFDWNKNARARLLFLVLDAPPHEDQGTIRKINDLTYRLAAEGIRVIPVACSGVNKETEFIMRSIALATNGTYVFLTDDSGIGGSHTAPSTDSYEVEKLNDLFIRLIDQFTIVPDCNAQNLAEKEVSERIFNEGDPVKTGGEDISEIINCYPNPSDGIFTIEITKDIDELYIVDIAGKIIENRGKLSEGRHEINISRFPTGIYFVRYMEGGEWGLAKVVLQR
jgi:hypothetical protein